MSVVDETSGLYILFEYALFKGAFYPTTCATQVPAWGLFI